MKIPLSVRIKAFFAKDKDAFWFDHFTDEEKELRRMDAWQLAKVINEARVRNLPGSTEKIIVAEHMLNVRLAKIQATASWGSGVLGFCGAIIGAALSIALASMFQGQDEINSGPTRSNKEQAIHQPEIEAAKPVFETAKHFPCNPVSSVVAAQQPVRNSPSNNKENHNADAPSKP